MFLCFLGFKVFSARAPWRNNPVEPTTRVIPKRSGDFELHGKTDNRANTRATTSKISVSELSHGGGTSGAVLDHDDPVQSSRFVICAPALLPTSRRQFPEGCTCNGGCSFVS